MFYDVHIVMAGLVEDFRLEAKSLADAWDRMLTKYPTAIRISIRPITEASQCAA